MDKERLEIVSMVERRRKWPPEEKARIMDEALAPGTTVASVAGRNGIARSQVYAWLRKARAGKLPGVSVTPASCAAFVPVQVEPPASASPLPAPRTAPPARRRAGLVEIALGNGRSLKVDEEIDPAVLARLAGALDGGKR